MSSRPARFLYSAVVLALGLTMSPSALADQVTLDMLVSGQSRWFEEFSDAFAQLDGGPSYPGGGGFDGAYEISRLPLFVTIGGGLTAFPFGSSWPGAALLEVDASGLTGQGVELAPIVDVLLDLDTYVADNDAVTSQGYETGFSNIDGDVTYEDGIAVSVDLSADVTLSYDFAAFNGPVFDYFGTFTITSNAFAIDVSEPTYQTAVGPVGYDWDISGTVVPVPEPRPVIQALAALATILGVQRRRSHRGAR